MDLRRRHEGLRRKVEDALCMRIELGRRGEKSIVAGAGGGKDSFRNFPLHHDYRGFYGVARRKNMQQNWRSNVVGKIADYQEPFVAVPEFCKIDGEDIRFHHIDARKLRAQPASQFFIEFDGDQAANARSQYFSDRTRAGTDFNHRP